VHILFVNDYLGRLFGNPAHIVRGLVALYAMQCATCTPNTPASPTRTVVKNGMAQIRAAGLGFMQGSDSLSSPGDERPSFRSCFSYDYYLDTTEVTQGDYFRRTGKRPVADTSSYGVGETYPVYNVSWFDAVLYCNARSKADSLDTVYLYYQVSTAPSGSVYDLAGVRARFDVDGYRLPTEAEWEFADQGSVSPSDSGRMDLVAWYSANAGGATHPAASKQPTNSCLYDMAGNVFEWTNDWKGPYSAATITNSIGASQANTEFERVIKGGSFLHQASCLSPSCRSATYPTSATTAVAYVGFRCARGIIPTPSVIAADTGALVPALVDMTTSAPSWFLGTSSAKLVFVNDTRQAKTLCYIDYGASHPVIRQYLDRTDVHFPTISPDGKYVSFCTRGEGFGGHSNIFVRSLDSLASPCTRFPADSAFAPKWWIDGSSGDTCIVYASSFVDCDLPEWAVGKTYIQKVSGGKPVGQPRVLVDDGAYHDGLSRDGDYAVAGYTRCKMRRMSTGAVHELFLYPYNGKPETGSSQVCNVTICPDSIHAGRCMFLDFGSPVASLLTDEKYGIHQYLFIADYSGTVVAWYKAPEGEASWEHPAWANDARYAASVAGNAAGAHHAVYLLKMGDGFSSLKAVEGEAVEYPYLWIPPDALPAAAGLALDSLGYYNEPPVNDPVGQLAAKMHFFWQLHDSFELVAVGSSMTKDGFNPLKIQGLRGFNLGYNSSGDLAGQVILIKNYLLPFCPMLKLVCMSLDPGRLWAPGGSYSWNDGPALTRGFQYDKNHSYWTFGLPPGFKTAALQAPYPKEKPEANPLGYFPVEIVATPLGWGGSAPPLDGSGRTDWTTELPDYQANLSTIRMLSSILAAHDVELLVINFPICPGFKNMPYAGYFGPSWETELAIEADIKAIEAEQTNFHFYDANNDGNHDYTDAEALNLIHLDSLGADKLSARVDSVIRTFLK
jgi:uncharacterized protein (TIGR02171 family)